MTIDTGPYMTTEAPIADLRAMLVAIPCSGYDTPDGHIPCEKGRMECAYEENHYAAGSCPKCDGWSYGYTYKHKGCQGTGRAFPGLSRECSRHEGQAHTEHNTEDGSRCIDGRMDAVSLEALIPILCRFGGQEVTVVFTPLDDDEVACGLVFPGTSMDGDCDIEGLGRNDTDAAIRALAAAVEAVG